MIGDVVSMQFYRKGIWWKNRTTSQGMFTLHIFEVLIFTTTLLIIKCTRATASRAGSDRTKESKGENAKKTLDGKLSGSHSTMSRSKKDRSNEQPRLISGKNKLSSEAIKRKMQHVEFDLKKKATEEDIKTDLHSLREENNPFKKVYHQKQEKEAEGKVEQHFTRVGEKEKDLSVYGMDTAQLRKESERTSRTQGMTRTTTVTQSKHQSEEKITTPKKKGK
ncbi:hypothetical protein Y032_0502g2625 [Ancylostoma ceylanicum]|uniref:Uncharacterized protein n=2 Tax=Ancylostoma ceylanicum TaxID=53326 RepID=A0A016WV55_9BILA|nr:hypothetical protein Y032_0502g2625 [Ancylostoma ceylanicum]